MVPIRTSTPCRREPCTTIKPNSTLSRANLSSGSLAAQTIPGEATNASGGCPPPPRPPKTKVSGGAPPRRRSSRCWNHHSSLSSLSLSGTIEQSNALHGLLHTLFAMSESRGPLMAQASATTLATAATHAGGAALLGAVCLDENGGVASALGGVRSSGLKEADPSGGVFLESPTIAIGTPTARDCKHGDCPTSPASVPRAQRCLGVLGSSADAEHAAGATGRRGAGTAVRLLPAASASVIAGSAAPVPLVTD